LCSDKEANPWPKHTGSNYEQSLGLTAKKQKKTRKKNFGSEFTMPRQ